MKILMLCVKSSVIINFRKKLIEKLQSLGHEVSCIVFDREHEEEIKRRNIEFFCLEDANRSVNPLKVVTLKKRYTKLIKEIAPDIVFTFMLKPNAFGVPAAKKAGVKKIFSMVEGLGDVYIHNSLKWKAIRVFVSSLYRKAFRLSDTVFFLNQDDRDEFVNRGLVAKEKCDIIHGIGVDLDYFTYQPIPKDQPISFLMIARLLPSKGVMEYCEAAKIVKARYPDTKISLLGPEASLTKEDLKEYIEGETVDYLGATSDVRPYLAVSSVHVLPSYREGLGLVNVEAAAIGRASITGDAAGTRDTVQDGYNGFLVPIKNSEALAEKMLYFIEHPDEAVRMGDNARRFAEELFDEKKINAYLAEAIGVEKEPVTLS